MCIRDRAMSYHTSQIQFNSISTFLPLAPKMNSFKFVFMLIDYSTHRKDLLMPVKHTAMVSALWFFLTVTWLQFFRSPWHQNLRTIEIRGNRVVSIVEEGMGLERSTCLGWNNIILLEAEIERLNDMWCHVVAHRLFFKEIIISFFLCPYFYKPNPYL